MSGNLVADAFSNEEEQETIIKKPGNSCSELDYQSYREDESIFKTVKEYLSEKW